MFWLSCPGVWMKFEDKSQHLASFSSYAQASGSPKMVTLVGLTVDSKSLPTFVKNTERRSVWTAWNEEALAWHRTSTSIGREYTHAFRKWVLPQTCFCDPRLYLKSHVKPHDIARSLNEQNYETNLNLNGTIMHALSSPSMAHGLLSTLNVYMYNAFQQVMAWKRL